MKLHIGNIHTEVQEEELKDLFSKYEGLTSMTLVKERDSGKSRGFAFVEYQDKKNADSAIKEFDGSSLRGMDLKVSLANVSSKRPARSSGLF